MEKSTASLKIEGAHSGEKTSYNVVATKKGTKNNKTTKSDIIYITGHHDSVAGAPGANDDASGTSVTLELARVLKNLPTDTKIHFVTFGAEENGLLGSQQYVDNLPDDDIIDKISKEKLQDVAEIIGTAVYDQAKLEAKKPDLNHEKGESSAFIWRKGIQIMQ